MISKMLNVLTLLVITRLANSHRFNQNHNDNNNYIFCGGFANIQCPSESYTCVDDPNDDCNPECGGADCGGICVIVENENCGGIAGLSCSNPNSLCLDIDIDQCNNNCNGADCSQTCVTLPSNTKTTSQPTNTEQTYQFCGGIAGFPCPDNYVCVDNPNDNCSPDCGGADCGGICVQILANYACGGIAGIQCPKNYLCIDEEGDNCNSLCGGNDCSGICIKSLSSSNHHDSSSHNDDEDDDAWIFKCVRTCRQTKSQCQSKNGKKNESACVNAFKQCMQDCSP